MRSNFQWKMLHFFNGANCDHDEVVSCEEFVAMVEDDHVNA